MAGTEAYKEHIPLMEEKPRIKRTIFCFFTVHEH